MNLIHLNNGLTPASSAEAGLGSRKAGCFLVYYDGGKAGRAALDAALDLMGPGTDIVALVWEPDTRRVAPRRSRSAASTRMKRALAGAARRGVTIRAELLHGDHLGRALVDRAARAGADSLFWGIGRSSSARPLNPAAEYILRFSPAKVVLIGI